MKAFHTNFMIRFQAYQKRTFNTISMTQRGALALRCIDIAQLMTHPAVYTLPSILRLYYKPLSMLQRATKS